METVTGVFRDSATARRTVEELYRAGFEQRKVNLLQPGAAEEQIHSVPTSPTEQPGMGAAIGGVLGGAIGVAGGLELGLGVTALIPGVGPVLAIGVAAAAVLGAGGVVAGAALGNSAEEKSTEGIPSDEVFFYEDALRNGKSVVFVMAAIGPEARRARRLLAGAGAESLDAARESWWLGLRDAEHEHYRAMGHDFESDQEIYRAGFESALRRECRGKSLEEASDCLKWWYPDQWDSEPFRRGYERGLKYGATCSVITQRSAG